MKPNLVHYMAKAKKKRSVQKITKHHTREQKGDQPFAMRLVFLHYFWKQVKIRRRFVNLEFPTKHNRTVWVLLTFPNDHSCLNTVQWANGLWSISNKQRMFDHFQTLLQMRHICLGHIKALNGVPVWGSRLDTYLISRATQEVLRWIWRENS